MWNEKRKKDNTFPQVKQRTGMIIFLWYRCSYTPSFLNRYCFSRTYWF